MGTMNQHRLVPTLITSIFVVFLSFWGIDGFNIGHHSNDTGQGEANEECDGINPGNFLSTLYSKDLIQEQIPVTNNRHCFCNATSKICPIVCYPCDDNTDMCQFYGTCCLANANIPPGNETIDLSTQHMFDSLKPSALTTLSKAVFCYHKSDAHQYFVVKSCPDDWSDVVLRMKCENISTLGQIESGKKTFVMDEKTNISYYNTYCAECNRALKVKKWSLAVECQTFFYVREALTEDELLRLSKNIKTTCILYQRPPSDSAHRCDSRFVRRENDVIKVCDTGVGGYSPYVERACLNLPNHIALRVASGTQTYKNIFCLICNRNERLMLCRNIGTPDGMVKKPPFRLLFGLDTAGISVGHNPSQLERCQEQEWQDPSGVCRPLACSEGKVLKSNHCKTALRIIAGLPYRLNIVLIPMDNGRALLDPETSKFISSQIRDQLVPDTLALEVNVDIAYRRQDNPQNPKSNSDHNLMLPIVWVTAHILSNKTPRDDVENNILSMFNIPVLHYTLHWHYQIQMRPFFGSFGNPCNSRSENCASDTRYSTWNSDQEQFMYGNLPIDYKHVKRPDFIPILPTLTCPYVTLSAEELQEVIDPWPVPHVSKIKLHLGTDNIVEITESSELNQVSHGDNGTFYVCVGLLNSKFEFPKTNATISSLSDSIQYFLTVACVSASLLCLSATITTYCLFPDLRCLAGCNTLGLSSSLFVAQILLLVVNTVRGPSILCTAMGVITHYSWLVMFTWTFICCLHMLHVFTRTHSEFRSGNGRRERKRVALNVATSLTVPMLVVIAIMVTNVIKYDQKRIGYGYNSCAMDDALAIYLPLIFITICNVVFFVIVVCKIYTIRRLQEVADSQKQNRKEFVVYIKLSTLTGVFWLLIMLGEVFRNDILRYLAIVANGCQGVFIFASFTANGRVLKHYVEKFNPNQTSTTETVMDSTPVAIPQPRKAPGKI